LLDYNGGGPSTYIQFTNFLLTLLVLLFGLRTKAKNTEASDKWFLAMAIISFFLWLIVKQPLLSSIIATLTALFAFVPTIRKSWKNPYSETLSSYVINVLRQAITLVAIGTYSIITVINPLTWVFANLALALLLILRRITLKK
ncbi:hypothetical protein COX64_04230, partial [Candidatus Dojkabacteria bacterium CG_4_10_14_0_2_um_filter_Dojkabacteria_WS6_41_15]